MTDQWVPSANGSERATLEGQVTATADRRRQVAGAVDDLAQVDLDGRGPTVTLTELALDDG